MLKWQLILILVPSIIGTLSAALCNMKNSGSVVKFRPPPYVFGVVWTTLYICMGIAWYKANESKEEENKSMINVIYSLIVLSLFLWVYIYSCKGKKKEASWFLIVITILVLWSLMIGPTVSRMLMCPLLAWCIFATIMNTTEIQHNNK